jgi:hypothetical protein
MPLTFLLRTLNRFQGGAENDSSPVRIQGQTAARFDEFT